MKPLRLKASTLKKYADSKAGFYRVQIMDRTGAIVGRVSAGWMAKHS